MKKTISFLLAVLLLCSVASVPMTALGAKKVKVDALDHVQVFPNNGRKGELRVCYGGFKLDGVQVYRSETGEKGTYKKVGTTRNSTFFVDDQGLKNNKRYFYAVRPFIKKNGKTYFGPFTKADGWTMLTAAYATKLLKTAYRIAAMTSLIIRVGSNVRCRTVWRFPAGNPAARGGSSRSRAARLQPKKRSRNTCTVILPAIESMSWWMRSILNSVESFISSASTIRWIARRCLMKIGSSMSRPRDPSWGL